MPVAKRLSQAEGLSQLFPLRVGHLHPVCCTLPLGLGKTMIYKQLRALSEGSRSKAIQSSTQGSGCNDIGPGPGPFRCTDIDETKINRSF